MSWSVAEVQQVYWCVAKILQLASHAKTSWSRHGRRAFLHCWIIDIIQTYTEMYSI